MFQRKALPYALHDGFLASVKQQTHRHQVVDDVSRCCCRGFHPLVGHHVEHALVALMAYARNNGDGEVGHVLCQRQRVETAQVGRCAATSYNNHHVEAVGLVINAVERVDDRRFHLVALHDGREQGG